MIKPLIVFDIDNTLTESRLPIDDQTSELICYLLEHSKVAVISGGSFEELESRIPAKLLCKNKLNNLFILPTTGAELYVYTDGIWRKEYTFPFDKEKRVEVVSELSKLMNVSESELSKFIEDRGTQLTYSALGAHAPLEDKKKWDPNREKRKEIVNKLSSRLSGVHMAIGGRTSIDFTAEGIDKAFGVSKLLEYLGISVSDTVFIGDALAPGGNDSPVKALGIETIDTSGPEETKTIIRKFLS